MKQASPKKSAACFFLILLVQCSSRMLDILLISEKKTRLMSLFAALLLIVLPAFYGCVSYFLVGKIPKALFLNISALNVSAALTALFTQSPPLSETVVILPQIPFLIVSFLGTKFIHTAKARKNKLFCLLAFSIPTAMIAWLVYWISLMIFSSGI